MPIFALLPVELAASLTRPFFVQPVHVSLSLIENALVMSCRVTANSICIIDRLFQSANFPIDAGEAIDIVTTRIGEPVRQGREKKQKLHRGHLRVPSSF